MRRLIQAGFSYTEVLVATALMAVALVPMMNALKPGLQGAQVHRDLAAVHFTLRGKMEEVLAQGFHALDMERQAAGSATVATVFSDTGASIPHEVFIWRWDADDADGDGDGLTGGEEDLLWVRVATTDGQVDLQTLVTNR